MKHQLLNRCNNSCVIFEAEFDDLGSIGKNRGELLRRAVLRDADLRGADLRDADLRGAGKIRALRAFHGVYQYTFLIMVAEDMTPWVWMGCQHRTVAEWDAMGGIRDSRPGEFPNNGSTTSERRARAYEFARAEVMHMVEELKGVA